ncbi:hypothetical protein [Actinomadura sp. GTD37]|uniref:hypothetical protein n=1 Tax=Actinomadura sp. GTD37 TaxID=1778030 RepID=UPI0035BF1B0E
MMEDRKIRLVRPLSLQTDCPVQLRVECTGTWSAWVLPGDGTIAARGSFLHVEAQGEWQIRVI